MGTIRVFRLTGAGDTSSTEFIDFNGVTKELQRTDIENAFIKQIQQLPSDGIGVNQGAELPLGNQQALGQVEDVYILDGFISKRNGDADDGFNAFLIELKQWESESKKVKGVWELGRFGIIIADDHTKDLEPDGAGVPANATKALLWERIEYTSDFKGNRENFKLYFRVNKGDGT